MSYKDIVQHRYSIKKNLSLCLGGKCNKCGYDKSLRALHFHHIDSNSKNFSISNSPGGMSLERILLEVRKCILLCANCHAELHDKLWKIEDIELYQFDDTHLYYESQCLICNNKFIPKSKVHRFCSDQCREKSKRRCRRSQIPTKEILQALLWKIPTTQIAISYSVSDKCVAKWAKKYDLSKPPRGYWAKKYSSEANG